MKYLSLLAICLNAFFLTAQDFTYEPSKAYTMEGPMSGSSDVKITINNNTSDTLKAFEWGMISSDMPQNWYDVAICDNLNCYYDVDTGSTFVMGDVAPGSSFYFKVTFGPNNTDGLGTLSLRYFDANNPKGGIADTLTFGFDTWGVGLNEFFNESIELFPNPVSDILNIGLNEYDDASVSIYNFIGQTIWKNQFSGQERIKVNCTDFAKGTYFIKIETKSGVITRKIIKK